MLVLSDPLDLDRTIQDLETRERIGFRLYEPLRESHDSYLHVRAIWEEHLDNLIRAAYYERTRRLSELRTSAAIN